MASAWLLHGQRPNAAESVGGLLLVVGVLVTLRPSQPPQPPQPQQSAAQPLQGPVDEAGVRLG